METELMEDSGMRCGSKLSRRTHQLTADMEVWKKMKMMVRVTNKTAENEDFSTINMKEEEEEVKKKINIYLHVVDIIKYNTKVVSMLYIIQKDRDFIDYNNTCGGVYEGEDNPPALIKPVLQFDSTQRLYPSGMSCIYFDSRLYFMGGSISYTQTNLSLVEAFEDTLECFPPDVYVFDCNTGQLLLDQDSNLMIIPPMNSGKPPNPITFLVGDELYVLSSKRGPHGMIHFEKINPRGPKHHWEKLPLPPHHDLLFSQRKTSNADGSCVMDRKLFVIFSLGFQFHEFHLLCYDIDSRLWTSQISSSYLFYKIFRDSVFIGDTIYTAVSQPLDYDDEKYHFPLHSFSPVSSAHILDQNLGIHKHLLKPNLLRHYKKKWPIYDNTSGISSRHLLHLGRHFNATTTKEYDISRLLGFVELSKPRGYDEPYEQDTVSEFSFIVFEPLNSDRGIFNTKTFYACRLSTDIYNHCELNAAGVYTS